jgi:hypothetical protein
MRAVLSYWLLAALVLEIGAHVALLVGLFRRRRRLRGVLALFVPPLAPYFGWSEGMRRRSVLWLAALVAYALGVAVAYA